MNEDFVTYEIAKKLKKKGFPQYTEKSYFVGDQKKRMCSVGTFLHVHTQNAAHLISAPTISQVLKWLREEYKIYMYVERDTYHLKFRFVYEKDKPRGTFTSSVYDKFEQAALAGIEYVIDNLI